MGAGRGFFPSAHCNDLRRQIKMKACSQGLLSPGQEQTAVHRRETEAPMDRAMGGFPKKQLRTAVAQGDRAACHPRGSGRDPLSTPKVSLSWGKL